MLPIVSCCFFTFDTPSMLMPATKIAIKERCNARERINGTY